MRFLPTAVVFLLLLLLCTPALAEPDAASAWKKNHKNLTKHQEAPYWDGFERSLGEVWAEWRSEWGRWRGDPETYRGAVHSLERLREIYATYAELQDARVRIDEGLAASNHPKTKELLLDALLDVIDECRDLDEEIAGGRPIAYYSRIYDQIPAVKRYGLQVRVDGLIDLLAHVDGGAAWLAEWGWKAAQKSDKTKSIAGRVAVLDALGASKDEAARPRLEAALASPAPGLRIAAIEGLVPLGAGMAEVLRPLLADPAPQVRRALLETIARRGADDPLWIPLALEAYGQLKDLARARALEALGALTGEALPDETGAWDDWYAENQEAILAGEWTRRAPPKVPEPKDGESPGEAAPATPVKRVVPRAVTTFYGVGAPSPFVVFAFDGSDDVVQPADLTVQTSKSQKHWRSTAPGWMDDILDHRTLLLRQLGGAIDGLPERARFATVHLWGGTPAKIPVMGDRKPLAPSKSTRKKVLKAVEKAKPQGQLSVEEATRAAFRIGGHDPLENPSPKDVLLDTVFIVAPGWSGGRWPIPEALLDDFERTNRFHRLQVNTIRITDMKEDSVLELQGLADRSGGTYHWLEKIP